jgi:hypothetical protein
LRFKDKEVFQITVRFPTSTQGDFSHLYVIVATIANIYINVELRFFQLRVDGRRRSLYFLGWHQIQTAGEDTKCLRLACGHVRG